MRLRNRLGLAGKHFLIVFPISMAILALLIASTLDVSRQLLESQILNRSSMMIDRSNQYLDLYAQNLRNLFLFIRSDREIFDLDPDAARAKLLAYYNSNPAAMSTLYLVREDNQVISSRQGMYDLFGTQTIASLRESVNPSLGSAWTNRYLSPVSGTTVSFVMNLERETLVADLRLDSLYDQIRGQLNLPGQTVVITASDGTTIAFDELGDVIQPRRGSFPADLPEDFLTLIGQKRSGAHRIVYAGRQYALLKSSANELDWNLYVLVDSAAISRELKPLYANFRRIGAALILLSVLSTVLLSFIVTYPIRRLSRTIDRVQSLKELAPIPNQYHDEFADLVDSYNAMMDRVITLASQKHDAEWRMLQSQIGPHFLYNTLGCVSSLAQRYRIDEAQETIRALVALLRYSFDRTREMVKLKDELELLRKYVYIQSIRYTDMVRLHEDVPAGLEEVELPALLLQPVVENSVFHGIIPSGRRGTVTIRARAVDGDARIQISDDGIGISDADLACITAWLASANGHGAPSTHKGERFSSIGLRNIRDRLAVQYGEEYRMEIQSVDGAGTTVTLRVPLPRSV